MNLWVAVQTNVTQAYSQGGISLSEVANAIADNLDTAEIQRLMFFLQEEFDKKLKENSITL